MVFILQWNWVEREMVLDTWIKGWEKWLWSVDGSGNNVYNIMNLRFYRMIVHELVVKRISLFFLHHPLPMVYGSQYRCCLSRTFWGRTTTISTFNLKRYLLWLIDIFRLPTGRMHNTPPDNCPHGRILSDTGDYMIIRITHIHTMLVNTCHWLTCREGNFFSRYDTARLGLFLINCLAEGFQGALATVLLQVVSWSMWNKDTKSS